MVLLGWAAAALADLAPEPLHTNTALDKPTAHWVLYLDFSLAEFTNSRYVLLDADRMEFKAHIASGQIPSLQVSPDGSELYVADTWVQGPDRKRRDLLSVYDTRDYSLKHSIELPSSRALMLPRPRTALVHEGRLLVLFNFTPGTSVTVIDLAARKVVSDIPTPGCSLVYPTGTRSVSMLCGDGTLLTLELDANGGLRNQQRSHRFFDPDADPVMENAASIGGTWYFPSYGGDVYPVDLSGETPTFHEAWALVDHDARPAGLLRTLLSRGKAGPWLPGGYQVATAHRARGELYMLVHPITWSESKGDHVFPGAEVWVYDAGGKRRVRRIGLRGVGVSIHVTQDAAPLLLVSAADPETEKPRLEVYDAVGGDYLREFDEFGSGVLYFETPVP
jgi:methylamine dehydrogenase heavy chain